jgi:hypothetical protein
LCGFGGVSSIRFSVSLNLASSSFFGASGMINPAFINYPEEAALLGAMVIGYGEIDLSFAHMAGLVVGQTYAVLDACHAVRSETARLDVAHALAAGAFKRVNLEDEYTYTHAAVRHCLRIRNQHAHSQWGDLEGLHLSNAERAFSQPLKPIEWKPITLELLKQQEAYFEHTRLCVLTMITLLEQAQKRVQHIRLTMPKALPRPNLHSQPPKQARARKEKELQRPPQARA